MIHELLKTWYFLPRYTINDSEHLSDVMMKEKKKERNIRIIAMSDQDDWRNLSSSSENHSE